MSNVTFCERCGQAIHFGMFPFCPHGPTHAMIVRDEIPGGVWLENYGPDPIKVYSHSERRKLMGAPKLDHMGREYVLTEKDQFSPLPGTDKDAQGIPNPAGYLDPKTLDNARVLIERAQKIGQGQGDPQDDLTPVDPDLTPESTRSVQGGTFTYRDAERIAKAARQGTL